MLFDLSPLYHDTNAVLQFSFTFPVVNITEDETDEASSMISTMFPDVTFPVPISVTGQIISKGEYPVLKETATVTYHTACARCAEDVDGVWTVTVEKPIADENNRTGLQNKDNDDYLQAEEGKLDLEAPVRDEILLSFPTRFFCRDDCKGLCPGCGANLNRETCRCQKKPIDPRFAKLAALLDSMPDDDGETKVNK